MSSGLGDLSVQCDHCGVPMPPQDVERLLCWLLYRVTSEGGREEPGWDALATGPLSRSLGVTPSRVLEMLALGEQIHRRAQALLSEPPAEAASGASPGSSSETFLPGGRALPSTAEVGTALRAVAASLSQLASAFERLEALSSRG